MEDCDAPPEKAPKEITPPESGFAFDPAHAFERFDYDAIKDAELREKTRDGVEKILGAGSPTSLTGPTSPTNPYGEIVSLEELAKDGGDAISIGVSQETLELSNKLECNVVHRSKVNSR